ncbi:HEPN domain-containing protein [Pseudohongiella sp. SYSU M77423]|uniref:HEPN domain-containing protein n=1 Tax=Pseudohongiella sp. SYSU M77423 TaxID=3042312 RepID=UPI00247FFC6A|nr:HEPN domain-containing protein [Pseudohongiella sp. SYSU M77423]MDH7943686.1 HEPN domain-containing protein [Pseudohongiella sp. SYSU M77423]MDH7943702.1 HEPN domain-containing protein [Pseudohongiella sp. SYSU M77423]
MKKDEIEKIVQARVEDAQVLYESSRYDGSVYLCGYAIELGLKARICRTLQWDEYPTSGKYNSFKTHDLDVLLHLTGCEDKVKLKHLADWSIVAQWNPEARYNPIGSVQNSDAKDMLESTKELLKIL